MLILASGWSKNLKFCWRKIGLYTMSWCMYIIVFSQHTWGLQWRFLFDMGMRRVAKLDIVVSPNHALQFCLGVCLRRTLVYMHWYLPSYLPQGIKLIDHKTSEHTIPCTCTFMYYRIVHTCTTVKVVILASIWCTTWSIINETYYKRPCKQGIETG